MRLLTILMLVAVTVTAQTPDEDIITQGGTGKVWRHKRVIVVQEGGSYTFTANADTVLHLVFPPGDPVVIHMTAGDVTPPTPPVSFTKVDESSFAFSPSVGSVNVTNGSGWSRFDADISPNPSWCQSYYEKSCTYSNVTNATATFSFTGTQIKLHGEKSNNKGRMQVKIMAGATTLKDEEVDLFASTTTNNTQVIYDSGVLAPGAKTVTVTVKGTTQGSGTNVQLDAIEYK